MNQDRENLIFIYNSLLHIEDFNKDGESHFTSSELISSATIRKFEVIGEAIKNLSDELKSLYPDVPWRKLAGFRDVLIHKSMLIDTAIVWDSVERDVPKLLEQFSSVLGDQGIEIPLIS